MASGVSPRRRAASSTDTACAGTLLDKWRTPLARVQDGYKRVSEHSHCRPRVVLGRANSGLDRIIVNVSLIPTRADDHALAQSRRPMDMMSQGWSMRRFQASQQ